MVDLASLLNKMGASVEGAGTPTIRIEGVEQLHGAEHEIIADRIEAGTFILAGAMTGGDLRVTAAAGTPRCAPRETGPVGHRNHDRGADDAADTEPRHA